MNDGLFAPNGLHRACYWLALLLPGSLLISLSIAELLSVITVVVMVGALFKGDLNLPCQSFGISIKWPFFLAMVFSALCVLPLATEQYLTTDFIDEVRSLRWMLFWLCLVFVFQRAGDAAIRSGLALMAGLLCLISLYGALQFWCGIDFSGRETGLHLSGERYRAQGTYSLPQSYAGVVGMFAFLLFPLSVGRLTGCREPGQHAAWLLPVATLAGIVAVLYSGTRGAYLGLFWSVLLGLMMMERAGDLGRRAALGVVVLTLGLAALTLLPTGSGFVDKIAFAGEEPDRSLSVRLPLWQAYLAMITDSPWVGYGAGVSSSHLPAYYDVIGANDADFISHAHSNYLQAWVDGGAAAFAAYNGLIITMLIITFRGVKAAAHSEQRLLFIGLFIAQIYFHLFGLTESNFLDIKVNHALIVIWSLALAGPTLASPAAQSRS